MEFLRSYAKSRQRELLKNQEGSSQHKRLPRGGWTQQISRACAVGGGCAHDHAIQTHRNTRGGWKSQGNTADQRAEKSSQDRHSKRGRMSDRENSLTASIFPLRLLSSPRRLANSTVVTPPEPTDFRRRAATEAREMPSTSSLRVHDATAPPPKCRVSNAFRCLSRRYSRAEPHTTEEPFSSHSSPPSPVVGAPLAWPTGPPTPRKSAVAAVAARVPSSTLT